jgi:hypothetical protein
MENRTHFNEEMRKAQNTNVYMIVINREARKLRYVIKHVQM